MTKRRARTPTPRPAKIETAAERGQALRHWLELHKTSVKAFAAKVGYSRAHMHRYLVGALDPKSENGAFDIAYMPQERAEALICAMNVTDFEAWEILNIPQDAKKTFRTFRPPPTGHGSPVRDVIEIRLTEPMVGEVALPAETVIRIDPAASEARVQIVRLEDGRIYAASQSLFTRAGGEHLGGLLSAHF